MKMDDIETIKKKLRRHYGFFEYPKKSDRIDLTEEQWKQIDWTQDEIQRNIALPHKMWNRRHDDRPWPLCKQWRGNTAYGTRAPIGHKKHIASPPKLIKAWNCTRWMTPGDESVVMIDKFKNKYIKASNLPELMHGVEMNPSNKDFGQTVRFRMKLYGPSSIQKFINEGETSWLIRDPRHYSFCRMIKKRERHDKPKSETGADVVAFSRVGYRFDSLDSYYIRAMFFGFAWN